MRPRWIAIAPVILFAVACGAPTAQIVPASISPPPRFLLGLNPINYTDNGPDDTDITETKRMGAHSMRIWINWREIEPTRGIYDWANIDRLVNALCEQGIEPWALVVGAPPHATRRQKFPSEWDSLVAPDDLPHYEKYLRQLVERYRGKVRHYEIWNEVDHHEFYWKGSHDPATVPSDYAELLAISYRTIKAIDPQASVIMSATAGTNLPFVRKVLEALNGRKVFDGIAAHPYRWSDQTGFHTVGPHDFHTVAHPDGGDTWVDFKEELLMYRRLLEDHGDTDPVLWITEFGYPAHDETADSAYVSLLDQARYLSEIVVMLEQPEMRFVKGLFWFCDRDWATDPNDPVAQKDFGYFGFAWADYRWKPAAETFRKLAAGEPHGK